MRGDEGAWRGGLRAAIAIALACLMAWGCIPALALAQMAEEAAAGQTEGMSGEPAGGAGTAGGEAPAEDGPAVGEDAAAVEGLMAEGTAADEASQAPAEDAVLSVQSLSLRNPRLVTDEIEITDEYTRTHQVTTFCNPCLASRVRLRAFQKHNRL